MKNSMMKPRELNVKVGGKVSVQGNRGIVTEVLKAIDTEWNGKSMLKYQAVSQPQSVFTSVVSWLTMGSTKMECTVGTW